MTGRENDEVSAPPPAPRRVYERDPIQEALCEFKFRGPSHGWAVIPGQLFERLQHLFPAEPEVEGMQRGLQMGQPGGITAEIVFGSGPQGVRLQSEDATRLVRIRPGLISVHVLAPYPQWPAFRGLLEEVLRAVEAVASEGLDIERVGVRYINRVAASPSDGRHAISEYFAVRPLEFPGVEVSLMNFLGRTEHRVGLAGRRKLISTFASTGSEDASQAYMLDLDLIADDLQDICTVETALEIASELRELERQVFEASITESARRAFGGYKEESVS